MNIETNIINLNFFLLFLTMLFYWLKITLFLPPQFCFLPNIFIIVCSFLQTTFLCLRWISSGHFPISNLYESLLFLSWILNNLLILLNSNFISIKSKVKNKFNIFFFQFDLKKNTVFQDIDAIFGSILTPLILLINTFVTFNLPTELKITNSLVPALQSNWLLMHVTIMMLSYGTLLCGCLFSIAYLIFNLVLHNNLITNKINQKSTQNLLLKKSLIDTKTFDINIIESNLKLKENDFIELTNILDNLSYRILGLGFPLLTIGILSGAVWANQTWGSYWSWDPKETWALITWFIFAIYLHTRLSKGWSGFKSALLASFGFIIIWICYLGVNLLGTGLHSYGFFN